MPTARREGEWSVIEAPGPNGSRSGSPSRKGKQSALTDVIGRMPYRLQLAGGWIDQPFVSRLNPCPPGSMVVVSLEPTAPYMDRCGLASSTRQVAMDLWGDSLPDRAPETLARELYTAENRDRAEPSGSQDMIGLIYPGVSRLDYSIDCHEGYFPARVVSNCEPRIAAWIEEVIQLVPVCQRTPGYNPLTVKNLDPTWIGRLGESGKACYDSILATDIEGLGESLNECMRCWEAILPYTLRHPTVMANLVELLRWYQSRYVGAMYSGCGGGYLIVVSDEPVPGAFRINVRIASYTR